MKWTAKPQESNKISVLFIYISCFIKVEKFLSNLLGLKFDVGFIDTIYSTIWLNQDWVFYIIRNKILIEGNVHQSKIVEMIDGMDFQQDF